MTQDNMCIKNETLGRGAREKFLDFKDTKKTRTASVQIVQSVKIDLQYPIDSYIDY